MGRLLLLLDLNGVLFYRPSKPCDSIVLNNLGSQLVNSRLVLRPWVTEFLSFCFKHFDVGIWTSLTVRNAYPLVARILGPNVDISHPKLILDDGIIASSCILPKITNIKELDRLANKITDIMDVEEREMLLAQISILRHRILGSTSSQDLAFGKLSLLWTQKRCSIVKNGKSFNMKRDRPFMLKNLSFLWKHPKKYSIPIQQIVENIIVNTEDDTYHFSEKKVRDYNESSVNIPSKIDIPGKFDALHTLLIDDSSYKFSQTPLNGIVIPSFNENSSNDCALLHLKDYLSSVVLPGISEPDFDIRQTIENSPFSKYLSSVK